MEGLTTAKRYLGGLGHRENELIRCTLGPTATAFSAWESAPEIVILVASVLGDYLMALFVVQHTYTHKWPRGMISPQGMLFIRCSNMNSSVKMVVMNQNYHVMELFL